MDTRRVVLAGLMIVVGGAMLYAQRRFVTSAIYNTLPAGALGFLPAFQAADRANGLPPGTMGKIAYIESRFNPTAYNANSGATGIVQIVPQWHPTVNPNSPTAAIAYAGAYIRRLYDRFGDWNKAIAAYNWGEGNLSGAINNYGGAWFDHVPTETRDYVIKFNTLRSFR